MSWKVTADNYVLWGTSMGFIRGVVEAIRLHAQYPVNSGSVSLLKLALQSGVLYALVIGITGSVIVRLILLAAPGRRQGKMWIPMVFLLAIMGMDLLGWASPVAPACLLSRDLDEDPSTSSTGITDILLVSIDTCRQDHLGCYGRGEAYTPVMDRFASTGIMFTDTVTAIPVTTPAHVSLFSGLLPPVHGSRFNAVPVSGTTPTLATLLNRRGYRCGAFIGAFPVTAEVSGLNRGFHVYDQLLVPRKLEPLLYRTTLVRPLTRFSRFRPAERPGRQVTNSVLGWWRKTPDPLRFTWVHYYDPHLPYTPPATFYSVYDSAPNPPATSVFDVMAMNRNSAPPDRDLTRRLIAAYDGEIAYVDREIGRLLVFLAESGRLDTTLIVVTADHGESLDEHGYFFSHGDHIYDVSVRIPLILHIPPGVVPPDTRGLVSGQTQIVDIAPTILGLMGETAVTGFDGMDLSAYIRHGHTVPSRHAFLESGSGIYIEAHAPRDSRIQQKTRGVRTGTEKIMYSDDLGFVYYDLAADPGETAPVDTGSDGASQLLLAKDLSTYIHTTDTGSRQPVRLPDPATLEQLRTLGYLQ